MFEIGTIVKPQGIRGEIRVFPTTDDPSRFALLVGKEITIRSKGGHQNYKLLQARPHKNIIILKLENITDRNMAETLTSGVITIPSELALPLEEGEYFVRDLIGLTVEDECGTNIGTIKDVMQTNANDVYIIETPEGDSFMMPAIKKIIRSVLLDQRKMIVKMMDGLRELTI